MTTHQSTQFLLYKGENGNIKVDVLVQDETQSNVQVLHIAYSN